MKSYNNMEGKAKIRLQLLHFNDTYEIENTPLFTASFLSTKRKFLESETPELLKENKIFRKSVDLTYEHEKMFGINHDKKYILLLFIF
jgi:hypothetical protein